MAIGLSRRAVQDWGRRLNEVWAPPRDDNLLNLAESSASKGVSDIYHGVLFQRHRHVEPEDAAVFIFFGSDDEVTRRGVTVILPTIPEWRAAGNPPLEVPTPKNLRNGEVTASG